ncbi:MAG TPA: DUF4253 domain-containing protein [Candidatus Dormibacteraeota bacterium]|nr:DUF4253 domain-containing protein [Candidatus Dormibacteraeota bacterium]
MRRFEFVGGTSSKFWEISQTGTEVTVHFGRIGSDGQTQTKNFDSWDEAAERVRKLVAEKLREGYKEVAGSGPTPESEPGFRTPPTWPPYEIPLLPGDGPARIGNVKLPSGRWLGGSAEFAPRGEAPIAEPVLWATNDVLKDAGRTLYQLRAPAAARNLVPVLLVGLDGEPGRPWDTREFCPTDPRRSRLIDVSVELAKAWQEQFESEDGYDEARQEAVRPFGKGFPGLSRPATMDQIEDDESVLSRMRDRRVALVAAERPADVPVAIGWMGAVNVHDDPALISAVLRSWEIRWNARLVEIGFDTLTLSVGNLPRDEKSALALAAEHCAFCSDNVWQGAQSIAEYARVVRASSTWRFWWD